jgi:hypothetical protein
MPSIDVPIFPRQEFPMTRFGAAGSEHDAAVKGLSESFGKVASFLALLGR